MKVTFRRLDSASDVTEKVYELEEGSLVSLGRGPELQIDSTAISRKHAELSLTVNSVVVKCLHKSSIYVIRSSSEDPTEVSQGSQAELIDGSELWFTKETFKFRLTLEPDQVEGDEVRPKATGMTKKRHLPNWMGGVKEALDTVADTSHASPEDKGEKSKTNDKAASAQNDSANDGTEAQRGAVGGSAAAGLTKTGYPTVITAADYLDSDEDKEENRRPAAGSSKPAHPRHKKEAAEAGARGGRRPACRYGASCYRKNPHHFQHEAHPGDADYAEPEEEDDNDKRPECEYGLSCYRKNPDHKKRYKHTRRPQPKRRAKDAASSKPSAKKGGDSDFIDDTDEEPVDDTDEDATWEMKDTDEDD